MVRQFLVIGVLQEPQMRIEKYYRIPIEFQIAVCMQHICIFCD